MVLTLTDQARALARVRTEPAACRDAQRTLHLVRRGLRPDPREGDHGLSGGRIDRMFVDHLGSRAREGDHLYRIYSPELVAAHEELLQAKRTVARLGAGSPAIVREGAERTLDAVRARLRRWGLSSYQLACWKGSRRSPTT
ncbi:MAG: efflux RND transporter periplasmic adaptor subunit [bacterium]